MATKIILTLDEDLPSKVDAHEVKIVLLHALMAYRTAREPVEEYVAKRYPNATPAERTAKVLDVCLRIDLAAKIRGASVEIGDAAKQEFIEEARAAFAADDVDMLASAAKRYLEEIGGA